MTTEAKAPSAFQKAEGGARHAVLQVGLGVVGFIVGGLLTAGATARLAERIGPVDSEAAGFALGWVLQRLWLFVVVPLFGWAIGRFTELRPFRFAVTACLAGEVFALLLATAINGFEAQVAYPPDEELAAQAEAARTVRTLA